MISKRSKGVAYPCHDQFKTSGVQKGTFCDVKECQDYYKVAGRSGLGFFTCKHVQSVKYAEPFPGECSLSDKVLDGMVASKSFSTETATHIPEKVRASKAEGQNPITM